MVEPKLSPKWSVMERRFYTQACAGPRKNYNMTFLKWHYWSQWHSWSGHCSGEGSWWTNLRACLTFTISPPLLSELREKCKIAVLIKYQRNNLAVAYLPFLSLGIWYCKGTAVSLPLSFRAMTIAEAPIFLANTSCMSPVTWK